MKMKKRLFNTLLATTLVAVTVVTGLVHPETAKAAAPEAPAPAPIYRLYNPDNGEHLYTTDANERNVLYNNYGWGYEGVAWYSANTGTPVYRLYNNALCNHLYTTDLNEINVLTTMENSAWTVDNDGKPLFYSGGNVPIYRVYNEKLQGMHHLTTDRNEYNTLPDYGWAQEGMPLLALSKGTPITTQYSNGGTNPIVETEPNLFPYELYTPMIVTGVNGEKAVGFYHLYDNNPYYNMVKESMGTSPTWQAKKDTAVYLEENDIQVDIRSNRGRFMGTYDDWGAVWCEYEVIIE